jgi:hypothetical protein
MLGDRVFLLKSRLKHPATTTLQIELSRKVCHTLKKHAKFIDAKPSYVVAGVLKLLFTKEAHFNRWLAEHTSSPVELNPMLKLSHGAAKSKSFQGLISSSQAAEFMACTK